MKANAIENVTVNIDFSDLIDIVITHPVSGEDLISPITGNPATVRAYSAQSDEYKKVNNRALNSKISKRNTTPTAEQLDSTGTKMISDLVTELLNFDGIELKGEGINLNNLHLRLAENKWFKDQLDLGIADNALALKQSLTEQKAT